MMNSLAVSTWGANPGETWLGALAESILTAVQSCHLAGGTWCPHHSSLPSQWLFCFLLNEKQMLSSTHGWCSPWWLAGVTGMKELNCTPQYPKIAPEVQQCGLCKEENDPTSGSNQATRLQFGVQSTLQNTLCQWVQGEAHYVCLYGTACCIPGAMWDPTGAFCRKGDAVLSTAPSARLALGGHSCSINVMHLFFISCFVWLHGEKTPRRIQVGTTGQNLDGVSLIVVTNFPHCQWRDFICSSSTPFLQVD